MDQHVMKGTRFTVRILLLAALLPLGACNVFETEEEIADEARVVITGTAPGPLQLITSTRFERWFDEEQEPHITLLVSDTASIALPFDQVYPVKPDLGFLVRLINPDMDPAVVSMKVYFDGELSYEQRDVSLSDASIEFNYIFSNFNRVR